MRTTLVLQDDLVLRAKARALEQGTTLSEIGNRALRDYLRDPSVHAAPAQERRVRLPSYRGEGPAVDLSPARIAELRDRDA
jgi:hypothetical protein